MLVLGDSKITVKFMLRHYKPAMRELVMRVQAAWDLIHSWRRTGGPRVSFRHIDRTHNSWADWLGRVGYHIQRSFDLEEFIDIWPTCDPALKEVGVGVWRSPFLEGQQLPGEMGAALEALPAALRWYAPETWVSAKSRGLKVESV